MGVGNDYDNAIARKVGPNQTLVHQYLTPTGDTYWVQMYSAPTPTSGTTVTINDTAPTTDRYNLSICEVLPASSAPQTWSISGIISPSSAGTGATVALSGAATATKTADASGNYSFAGLAAGSYTVTPTKSGYTFTPASRPVTITNANVASVNFAGQTSSTRMTAPASGQTVANLLTLWAVASDSVGVAGVQFLLDGAALGAEVTTAPYTITWDTRGATSGPHRLTARARNTSGLTTTSSPVAVTVDNSGNPAVVGSWSSVVNIPAVAVNLVLLRNNKVLFYQDGRTATVWDYLHGTFTGVPTSANLFCSGHALLADGRVLIVGGYGGTSSYGIANAEIFDPANNSWTAVPNMSYKRWYPTATTLGDGRILVTAGWQATAHSNVGIPEIYNATSNTWTKLTSANNPFETYPFIYQLSDGRVVRVGNSEYATVTDILDLNTQKWSVVDPNIVDGGSPAMYLPGKIVKAGSAKGGVNGPSSNTTYVLDMTQSTPAWRQTPSMAYARTFLNLVTLPDGNVLAVGGESDKNGGTIANAVYTAELW